MRSSRAERVRAFPPILGARPRILVLGSLPGLASLQAGEYYAHPRNAFWRIIEDLFGIPAAGDYGERTRGLRDAGIALWDVCAAAHRPGSLDSAIRADGVKPNDFATFFRDHPRVGLVALIFKEVLLSRMFYPTPNLYL